jgi:PAS domain S-box-containing protein
MRAAIGADAFRQILVRAIALPLFVIVLLSGGLLAQSQILLSATGWVSHSNQVITQANQIQRLLIDLETGVRGYLLTSDARFLEPYTNAQNSIASVISTTEQLVRDNPTQQQQLTRIRADYTAWNSDAQALLALHAAGGAYQDIEVNLRGKQRMDALRAHVATFIATEASLRDTRIQDVQNLARLIIGGGIVTLLLLGSVIAFYNRHQLRFVAHSYRDALATIQTQAEELQLQAEQFRVTLTSLGDAVIATDIQGQVTFLNPAAEHLTGWPTSDAVGQHITTVFQIVNEHTRQTVENPVTHTLRDGRIVGLANHTILIAHDGTEHPIDDSSAPIRNSAGVVIGAVLVFRDVSEKKTAEAAQRQSEERLRAALRGSPITVYAQDQDLRYTWLYNPAPGYNAADTIGKLDTDITTPEHGARLMELKRQVLATGIGIRTEVQVAGLTGDLFFDLTIDPLRDAQQNIIGVTGAAHDVTARKQAEQERLQLLALEHAARIEAQAAVQARDVFFSVASHELKTPLTSLLGNIQLIQRRAVREGFLNERDQRAFAVIAAQTRRLNEMIDALLDVSRLESGQLSLERTVFDLRTLVEQVVSELQPSLNNHTIVFQGPDVALLVEADSLRFEQVLQNLIQNAVKYSPAGGDVIVKVWQQDDDACVDVIDHGIGIPADGLSKLFTRFYRASNAEARQITGMGIGLYVVREILTLHGGTITVKSVEGEGSTFSVCFPVYAAKLS